MEVTFTQPYPIGTLSQLESIPLTSALKYLMFQHVHTLTTFPLETLLGYVCVCVCVVVVGTICTGFVVSKGNKYFHHAVVPLLFKMISGRH